MSGFFIFIPFLLYIGIVVAFVYALYRMIDGWVNNIYDINEPERAVTLDEVLPLYQKWWLENKGKSASQLQALNPLEGTGLVWLGTAAPA